MPLAALGHLLGLVLEGSQPAFEVSRLLRSFETEIEKGQQGFMLKQVHTSEHLTTYVWPSDVHTYLHHQRPLRGRSTYLLTVRLRIWYLKSLGAAASTYLLAKFSAASRPKYILTYVRVRCSASTCCLNMKPSSGSGRWSCWRRKISYERLHHA